MLRKSPTGRRDSCIVNANVQSPDSLPAFGWRPRGPRYTPRMPVGVPDHVHTWALERGYVWDVDGYEPRPNDGRLCLSPLGIIEAYRAHHGFVDERLDELRYRSG